MKKEMMTLLAFTITSSLAAAGECPGPSQISTQKEQIVLNLTEPQRQKLLEVLNGLNIQIDSWDSVSSSMAPSRTFEFDK